MPQPAVADVLGVFLKRVYVVGSGPLAARQVPVVVVHLVRDVNVAVLRQLAVLLLDSDDPDPSRRAFLLKKTRFSWRFFFFFIFFFIFLKKNSLEPKTDRKNKIHPLLVANPPLLTPVTTCRFLSTAK